MKRERLSALVELWRLRKAGCEDKARDAKDASGQAVYLAHAHIYGIVSAELNQEIANG